MTDFNTLREVIAGVIDPTARFEDLEGVTWSRFELERRELAYQKANAILALIDQNSFSVRWAAQTVLETFSKDEAQGYRSRDRQYAISILKKALDNDQAS